MLSLTTAGATDSGRQIKTRRRLNGDNQRTGGSRSEQGESGDETPPTLQDATEAEGAGAGEDERAAGKNTEQEQGWRRQFGTHRQGTEVKKQVG